MEHADLLLVEQYGGEDAELRTLIEQHRAYERDLEAMMGRDWLSPGEHQQLRVLKKRKLRGRDRIEEILRGYRRRVAEG